MSHVFTSGQHEIVGLPDTSPWAERYGCDARERRADIEPRVAEALIRMMVEAPGGKLRSGG